MSIALLFNFQFRQSLLSVVLMGLATLACADYPVTVVDDRDKSVALTAAPQRVAAVSIFGADLLTALRQEHNQTAEVVALSTRNHQLPAYLREQLNNIVDLGAAHETNLERLTTAKPDLTIGINLYTQPIAHKIEEVSPFLAFNFITWQDSDRAIAMSAAALNQAAQGQQMNDVFRARVAALAEQSPGGKSALFLWVWADTPVAFYEGAHLTTELMQALNVSNAMGKGPQGLTSNVISMEQLLKLNPDSIFVFQGDDAHLPYHPVWSHLKAYKTGNIYRISDQYVEPSGPIARRMVLEEMSHLLYPTIFSAPDNIPADARAKPARWAAAD